METEERAMQTDEMAASIEPLTKHGSELSPQQQAIKSYLNSRQKEVNSSVEHDADASESASLR